MIMASFVFITQTHSTVNLQLYCDFEIELWCTTFTHCNITHILLPLNNLTIQVQNKLKFNNDEKIKTTWTFRSFLIWEYVTTVDHQLRKKKITLQPGEIILLVLCHNITILHLYSVQMFFVLCFVMCRTFLKLFG